MDHKVPEPVEEEQRLLEVVLDIARRHQTPKTAQDYDAQLLRLRDEIIEERLPEDRASLLEQMDRVARLAVQRARYSETALDVASPYFGHMRLLDDKDSTRRDILIGKQTWVKDGVRIVDWRNAPISKVFYQRVAGEDFEIPIAGRMMEGEVHVRRTVTIREGALVRVCCAGTTWVRDDNGWFDSSASTPELRGGAGVAARPDVIQPVLGRRNGRHGRVVRVDKHLPEIASLLDAEQFELITRPDSGVVAIQGSAGSGKTTVALHRVAYLAYQAPRRFDGSRSLVVVFSPALARYISQVLPALGVQSAKVRTYEEWAQTMRRRLFPRLTDAYSEETPSTVTRFKLHSALIPMITDGWAANPALSPIGLWDELFTNRGWIGAMRQHAPDAFSEKQLDEIHRWCADRHFIRVDGGGHREDDVPTIDAEDDTILLYLYQLLKGRLPAQGGRRPLSYGHLVVDEAQDLSPLELKVLSGTVDEGGAITLAGDTAQRLVEDNDFQDWAQVLATIGLDHVALSPLRISYRSTASIMRLARHVLGPLAPPEPPATTRDGVAPQLLRFTTRGEAMTFLADAIKQLTEHEPHASIGILARRTWQADEAYRALERSELMELHRIADHDFSFAPGVEVTDIRQAKGLEFDYVVMVDVDVDTYPPTEASRHILHVGVTRAAHQLWCICVGTPSPLLPDWIETARF